MATYLRFSMTLESGRHVDEGIRRDMLEAIFLWPIRSVN